MTAFELEKFLISWSKVSWDEVSEEIQEYKDEEFRRMQGGPIGIGKHPTTGWFILGCGQGPFIIWVENGSGVKDVNRRA